MFDKSNVPVNTPQAVYWKEISGTPTTVLYYSHRFVLRPDHISDMTGGRDDLTILCGDEDKAEALLKEISLQTYTGMLRRLTNEARRKVEYLIAKNPDYRDAMIEAMYEQYKYARVSAGNLVAYQSGINPETGAVITAEDIRKMMVCQSAIDVLDTQGLLNQRIAIYVSNEDYRKDY